MIRYPYKRIQFTASLILVFLCSENIFAKPDLLPPGVGAFQIGYRQYSPQIERFDANGQPQALGAPLSNRFNGKSLLDGKGGEDLKKLVEQVQRFDSFANTNDSLVQQLDFGQMRGNVNGDITAQFLGVAYGLTRQWSLFLGIPFVQAEVTTSIEYSGINNASTLKNRLGNAAFDELKKGFDQAQALNAQKIIQSIESNGYQPLEKWSHSGVGDIILGTVWGDYSKITRSSTFDYVLQTTLSLPTGYVERPDILTDVNVGTGYYSIQNKLTPEFNYRDQWSGGGYASYQYNLSTTTNKRIPLEDEALVDKDRTRSVSLTPGDDIDFGGQFSHRSDWTRLKLSLGQKLHTRDRYSDGGLEGNYDALSKDSQSSETYHIVAAGFDTSRAFKKDLFLIPMIIQLTYYKTIEGTNVQNTEYYELSFASFFKGPF